MRHSYAKEKLGVAVNNLATGAGSIQERIWHAYLVFHTLKEKDFPDDLKAHWLDIHNTLTTEEPSYDNKGEVTTGRVQNTLSKLNSEASVQLAEKICSLNDKLHWDA